MKFFSIPNLSSLQASQIDLPWEVAKTEDTTPLNLADGDYYQWIKAKDTKSHFITLLEGGTPGLRVSQDDNPARLMHGIMADYDQELSPNDSVRWKQKAPGEYQPQWYVKTRSGGARLVWLFEKPIELLPVYNQLKYFTLDLSKQLGFKNWLPGLDVSPIENPYTHFALGRAWTPIEPDKRVPHEVLGLWMFKAIMTKRVKLGDGTGGDAIEIPMEKIEQEVHTRYPGKWKGAFRAGARGVSFWEADSTNPTSAVVLDGGMYSFSSSPPFRSWRDLLGNAFVQQIEMDRTRAILNTTAYDGDRYYVFDDERWFDCSKPDFVQRLRVRGISARQESNGSEIDRLEVKLKSHCRVHRAMPFMFFPKGILNYGGERYLNTCNTQVIPPQDTPLRTVGSNVLWSDMRRNTPFIYEVVTNLFAPHLIDGDPDAKLTEAQLIEAMQLNLFLAWFAHFYRSSYNFTPTQGCCMIIAGAPGGGKTLLNRRIVGDLMGGGPHQGYSLAQSHLSQGENWTASLAGKPLMAIDDALAASDMAGLNRFTSKVKDYVANATMHFNEKQVRTGLIPWFGRVVITCNLDAESMRIIPNLDQTVKDKIILLRTHDSHLKTRFPDKQKVDAILAEELPKLGRFLLDYEPAADLLSGRFGVKGWAHPDLYETTLQGGDNGLVLEVLHKMMVDYKQLHPDTLIVKATAAAFYEMAQNSCPNVMKSMVPRRFETALGILQKNGYNIHSYRDRSVGPTKIWQIGTDMTMQAEEKPFGP